MKKPPGIAQWILSRLAANSVRESLLGDLEEQFQLIARYSVIRAHLWCWLQVFQSLPAFLNETIYWSSVMFKNYLKVTFRNLLRHKSYTFINVSGLAVGIACCLLILMYIQHEIRYDKFHKDAGRTYRVTTEINWSGGYEKGAGAQFPVATALLNDYPAVESACRLFRITQPNPTLRLGDKQFLEEKFFQADTNFFDFFGGEFVAGSPVTALKQVNGVVITEKIADKYFGKQDPMGKLLTFNNSSALQVTGVVKEMPDNSHLKFDLIMSFAGTPNLARLEQNWFWNAFWTYIKLPDAQTAIDFQAQLPKFVQKYFPESIKDGVVLPLQRLIDIHLLSQLANEIEPNGNIVYVYIFSAIAIMILFIACINFMNLASARSSERAREVGVRKVLGAHRANLIQQFLSENVILSLIALVFALVLVNAALPYFNTLTGKSLEFTIYQDVSALAGLLGIGLFVGVVSGSYPALFLSNFQPIAVIKKRNSAGGKAVPIRKVLVVAQFVVSITLMICVGVVYEQLQFIQNKALGFDKEHLVVLRGRPEVNQRFEAFRNALLANSNVLKVTRATGTIPGDPTWTFRFVPEGMPRDKPKAMHIAFVDYDYVETLGLHIKEGRDFSREFPADWNQAFILNETAARQLNWQDDSMGKKLEYFGAGSPEIEKTGRVIGLLHDFHFESLHNKIEPVVLTLLGRQVPNPIIRIRSENVSETIDFLRQKWQEYAGQWPFEYSFVDQNLDQRYKQDARVGEVIKYFALLAIFIASLGLLGLAAFTAEKRTKEIGVRKVLGASAANILLLITSEFMRLVLIAFAVAVPLAFFAMRSWLENFAYGSGISPGLFFLAGGAAGLIAFIAVASQAIRAMLMNPVDTLRVE